ncbi:hypothetical protein [Winogradskya consettensis]|uniref:hypothetical protein n=1 Tax=Winogradskya consettensis TaxID=113560 RepID=UPI001FD03342|nr:hypothetical protein [Actinoplanes consettensis]
MNEHAPSKAPARHPNAVNLLLQTWYAPGKAAEPVTDRRGIQDDTDAVEQPFEPVDREELGADLADRDADAGCEPVQRFSRPVL